MPRMKLSAGLGRRGGGRISVARAILLSVAWGASALVVTGRPASAYYDFGFYRFYSPDPYFAPRARKKAAPRKAPKPIAKEAQPVSVPQGPVQVVVSVAEQRIAVYANGELFAQSAVSTGKKGHSTPTGVFSVLEKHRHHRSNIYSNAPMPYMQRLTWSGIALHAGELPGYPASHGCIRLSEEFAHLLWTATRTGARVVVAPSAVTPAAITHPRLVALTKAEAPLAWELRGPAGELGEPIRTAAAGELVPSSDGPKAAAAAPGAVPKISPVPQSSALKGAPVSILISRKTGKLQVRQSFKPLFEAAVAVRVPAQPWGTHVYTALAMPESEAGLRWTALSLPSEMPRIAAEAAKERKSVRSGTRAPDTIAGADPMVPRSAGDVLELFDVPQETLDRLVDLVGPGATLIVSDNAPSQETGPATDFIILTR